MGAADLSASSTGFLLNGRPADTAGLPASMTLLDYLRAQGLTAAKEGCAEGECGACAVAMVMPRGATSAAYQVVNSCLLALPLVAGREILTVEGLGTDASLHPVQLVLAEAGASQCGYCTPGFVMSLFAEQYRSDRRGPCDVHALAGNLCRCTGYRPIRDAAHALGEPPPGLLLDRLAHAAPSLPPVAQPGFTRPLTLDECLATLASAPDATLIAGGTDLGVEANLKGRRFAHLVSLEAIQELAVFDESANRIRIGAGLPLADMERAWHNRPTAVSQWLEVFASPLIRHRATLGGNLATASPIGDAAPLLLALDASVDIAGPAGRRQVPLSQFFTGYRRTVLARHELLVAVEIPKPLPQVLCFYKVSKRRLDDISTVAAAIALDCDAAATVRRARFAFGGVAATPIRARQAEEAVIGLRWNMAAVARVQAALERTLDPISDVRGSREYRLAVSTRLIEKCWAEGPR